MLIGFPQQQQWLHEHVSVLRYVYIACLVTYCTYFVKRGHPQNISFTGEAGRWLHFTHSKCFKKCDILQLSWLSLK